MKKQKKGKKKSIVRQAQETLWGMAAYGTSKHDDKAANGGKPAMEKIYSRSTMSNYVDVATNFAKWARDTHGCRDISDARQYTGEYLQGRMDAGKSAWTVRRDAAALGKLYQCPTTTLGVSLPTRHRGDVTQHRNGVSEGHKGYCEARNQGLADLCRATGLRRHEVAHLRTEDVTTTSDGRTLVTVRQGKGGKRRTVEALNNSPAVLAQQAVQEGREFVIDHIPCRAPIHEYRAQFAQELYDRTVGTINATQGAPSRKEEYRCRGELKGVVYDKRAMKVVSGALGHTRLDVVTSYLKPNR